MVMYSHVPSHVGMYCTQQTKMSFDGNMMCFVIEWTNYCLDCIKFWQTWLNDSTSISSLLIE